MNILVTGAAGFIGSHLCERLLANGHEVTGIDNFDPFYDRDIKEANLEGAFKHKNYHFAERDIRDQSGIEKLLEARATDVIVHLAARAGVRPSIADPAGTYDVNVNGTLFLLEAARKSSVKKFVFASSSSVYGNNEKVPFSETDPVDDPISPYAASKKAGELLCYTYHHLYDMDISCLRFFTVYGPRQRPDLAIHKFARLIREGRPIPVFGDGSMQRDFTYIDDIIQGVVAAMERCRGYEIFNLGESKPIRLDVLIREIEKALGMTAQIERHCEQPGDVKQTYADIRKAKTMLGYQPGADITQGLKHFADWLNGRPGS
jgi:UDP-glucuronate 4-epimerase